jgi:hypothetical protein
MAGAALALRPVVRGLATALRASVVRIKSRSDLFSTDLPWTRGEYQTLGCLPSMSAAIPNFFGGAWILAGPCVRWGVVANCSARGFGTRRRPACAALD